MESGSKKLLWITIGFVIILALGSHLALQWYGGEEEGLVSWLKGALGMDAAEESVSGVSRVIYSDKGFSPKKIKITSEQGAGCFITVDNQTDATVTVRVGPYEEGKEKGFLYPEILARQSSSLDPRYSGYEELPFYAKENPKHRFTVVYDSSCK
jgi:hypothetical protein